MNKAENLVSRLCEKTFLSLWSHPNPNRADSRKELCDVLVVCGQVVLIISVKEIGLGESGDPSVDWDRWRRRAIDESCTQIYGAERYLNRVGAVLEADGEKQILLPDASDRRIFRLAVALGSQGKVMLTCGDLGKGFVHVLEEESLDILMKELDTISDFVRYLSDKESLCSRVELMILGGEEDLLALYLGNGREFPCDCDSIIVDDKIWSSFAERPEYKAKVKADDPSYSWDALIEQVSYDLKSGDLAPELGGSVLPEAEQVVRVMAMENRFNRRLLGKSFLEFLELSSLEGPRVIRSRTMSSPSGVRYVFLACPHSQDRRNRAAELYGRCFVARGTDSACNTVLGIATERCGSASGFSLDVVYFHKETWTARDQAEFERIQSQFGFFANPTQTRLCEDEYPQV